MKTFLLISLLTLVAAFPPGILSKLTWSPQKEYVYICNSSTSACYHASKDCRGLNRCSHTIIRTTLDSAKNYYYKRACKICE